MAALDLLPALDDGELSLRERTLRGLLHSNVQAHALVLARVLEVDAQARERLTGTLLEVRLRLDVPPIPLVGPVENRQAVDGGVGECLQPLFARRVDDHVVVRRRVVVAVPDVLAAHDPRLERNLRDCP